MSQQNQAGPVGDYGYVVQALLSYLNKKGQIWSAAQMASIEFIEEYVQSRYGVSLGLRKLTQRWVDLSEIEASKWETVAQKNASIVADIGATVNYVEEQGHRVRFLPLGGKKRNNK